MNAELINTLTAILLYIGGPLIPLLFLAVEVDRWHRQHPDPAEITAPDQAQHSHDHGPVHPGH